MIDETPIDVDATQANADTADTTNAAETTETTEEGLPGDETTEEISEEISEGLPGDAEAESDPGSELKGAPEGEYGEWDISEGEDIGYAVSDEQKESFTKFGKDNNLDDKQMQGIISFDIARQKELTAATATKNEQFVTDYTAEGVKASRKEHGEKYGGMLNKNKNTYEKIFSEEGRKALNDMGISSQPWFFNGLNTVTGMISEDVTVPGDSGQQTTYNTYSELNPQTNVKNSQQ